MVLHTGQERNESLFSLYVCGFKVALKLYHYPKSGQELVAQHLNAYTCRTASKRLSSHKAHDAQGIYN